MRPIDVAPVPNHVHFMVTTILDTVRNNPFRFSRAASGAGQGLSSEGLRSLARLRRLAWLLDAALRLPGTRFRFGLSTLIGLPPGLGDVLDTGLSLYIVWEARQLGLPNAVIARMLANVAIEAGAGSVPVLGTLFDAGFKANLRNIALIEKALGVRL